MLGCDTNVATVLKAVIASHNRLIDIINGAEITCDLSHGREIWGEITCEGASIAAAAREAGINAKANMQSGTITVSETEPDLFIENDMTLSQIISSLRDQARYKDALSDKGDSDSIFKCDAAALRTAAMLLERKRV